MSGNDRILCPHCQANNFTSGAVCWQCGRPLHAEGTPSGGTEVPPPANPQDSVYPSPENTPPATEPASPYGQGPAYPHGSPAAQGTQIYIILGFVFAGLALFCCPPLFGIAAIVMGAIARGKGNPMGVWVIVAGAACLLIGGVIGAMLMLERAKGMSGDQMPFPMPPTSR